MRLCCHLFGWKQRIPFPRYFGFWGFSLYHIKLYQNKDIWQYPPFTQLKTVRLCAYICMCVWNKGLKAILWDVAGRYRTWHTTLMFSAGDLKCLCVLSSLIQALISFTWLIVILFKFKIVNISEKVLCFIACNLMKHSDIRFADRYKLGDRNLN